MVKDLEIDLEDIDWPDWLIRSSGQTFVIPPYQIMLVKIQGYVKIQDHYTLRTSSSNSKYNSLWCPLHFIFSLMETNCLSLTRDANNLPVNMLVNYLTYLNILYNGGLLLIVLCWLEVFSAGDVSHVKFDHGWW